MSAQTDQPNTKRQVTREELEMRERNHRMEMLIGMKFQLGQLMKTVTEMIQFEASAPERTQQDGRPRFGGQQPEEKT